MDSLQKNEIIEDIHSIVAVERSNIIRIYNRIFILMRQALLDGKRVSIPNFGTFVPSIKAARKGRHPTLPGQLIEIPRKYYISFKLHRQFMNLLNLEDLTDQEEE